MISLRAYEARTFQARNLSSFGGLNSRREKKQSSETLKVKLSVDITEFLPSPQAFPRLASKKCECLETSDKGEREMMGMSAERGE